MAVEFVTTREALAVRKAIDFWHRNMRGKMSLLRFLAGCRWMGNNRILFETCDHDR
jgi:hypothetical protein